MESHGWSSPTIPQIMVLKSKALTHHLAAEVPNLKASLPWRCWPLDLLGSLSSAYGHALEQLEHKLGETQQNAAVDHISIRIHASFYPQTSEAKAGASQAPGIASPVAMEKNPHQTQCMLETGHPAAPPAAVAALGAAAWHRSGSFLTRSIVHQTGEGCCTSWNWLSKSCC